MSNEEVKIALVPTFQWTVSEVSNSEQGILPGPSLERHPAIHEIAVPCAPPEMFQAGIIRENARGDLCLNGQELWNSSFGQALGSDNLPAEERSCPLSCCKEVGNRVHRVLLERQRK